MFGSGVPVCAVDFACIGELVRHGVNGCVFKSKEQLARQIIILLFKSPEQPLHTWLNSSGDNNDEISGSGSRSGSGSGSGRGIHGGSGSGIYGGSQVTLIGLKEQAGQLDSWSQNWDTVVPQYIQHMCSS